MDFYERLLKFKKSRKLNYSDLALLINKSGDAFRKAIKRKSFSKLEIKELEKQIELYDLPNSEFRAYIQGHLDGGKEVLKNFNRKSPDNITINEPLEFYKTKSGNNIEELPNGKYMLRVPMVPYRAYATYISDHQDAEFISDLSMASFVVDRVPKGSYRAFEIKGDSMNDATIEREASRIAILDGDVVLGRELGKQHWQRKLNTNGYPYWIIVHKDTIVCKEIINHDVERGVITCHSLNTSPEYSDFDLQLNECHQLFNIIKRQI